MSVIETHQLCHPELLSELTLREVLENRCVSLPIFTSLSKGDLIEIFKRIAMPLPQRKYNESQNLGKKLSALRAKRGINVSICAETTEIPSKGERLAEENEPCAKHRLMPPVAEAQQISKKIHLSNSCHDSNILAKRKNEITSISESKKRQKITWP